MIREKATDFRKKSTQISYKSALVSRVGLYLVLLTANLLILVSCIKPSFYKTEF